jgi:hypothetical protein
VTAGGDVAATKVESANGAITIISGGTVTATSVVSATDAEANDITIQGTTISAGVVNAGAIGDVFLIATTGAITDMDGKITADDVTATSAGAMTLDTTAAEILAAQAGGSLTITESDAVVLTDVATTAAGAVAVTAGGDVAATKVESANGAITITTGGAVTATSVVSSTDAESNDITIQGTMIAAGVVDAGSEGDVFLTATTGAITDMDGKITADDVTATSAGAMTLDTTVAEILAAQAGGSLTITESDAVVLTDVATTAAGAIAVTAGGDVAATKVESANGAITITSGGAVTATSVVSATDADANDITIQGTTIAAGVINAGSEGDVFLIATAGAITDMDGKITADQVTATSAGAMVLDTTVAEILAAQADGSLVITESDGITLTQANGFEVDVTTQNNGNMVIVNVSADIIAILDADGAITGGTIMAPQAALAADTGIAVVLSAAATTLAARTDGGSILIDASAGALTIGRVDGMAGVVTGSGNVLLNAEDVTLNEAVTITDGGNISILSGGSIAQAAAGDIASNGGTIDLEASSGGIAMADGALSRSSGGNIRYAASVDVVLGGLAAGAGYVSIAASTGSILDGGDSHKDVNAYGLRMEAGIGIGTPDNPLDIAVTELSASTGGGGVYLIADDDVTVVEAAPVMVERVQNDGTTSPDEVVEDTMSGIDVSAEGSVELLVLDGDLVVNESITTTGDGEVSLQARDITLNDDVDSESVSTLSKDGATFSWLPVDGAIRYYLEIIRNGSNFETLWVEENFWIPGYELPPGDYVWTVRPLTVNGVLGVASAPVVFTIVPRVQAMAPTGYVSSDGLEFTWSEVADATRYHLVIEKDGAPFVSQWVDGAVVWTPSGLSFAAGNYQWTVQPWNEEGYGLKSDPAVFTIASEMNESPTTFFPEGDQPDGESVQFSWAALAGVRWYYITIYRGDGVLATRYIDTATTWTTDFVFAPGEYRWTIQAWSPAGYGKASDPIRFVVPVPVTPQQHSIMPMSSTEAEQTSAGMNHLNGTSETSFQAVFSEPGSTELPVISVAATGIVNISASEAKDFVHAGVFYSGVSDVGPVEPSPEGPKVRFTVQGKENTSEMVPEFFYVVGEDSSPIPADEKTGVSENGALSGSGNSAGDLDVVAAVGEGDVSLIASTLGYILPIDIVVGRLNGSSGQRANGEKES